MRYNFFVVTLVLFTIHTFSNELIFFFGRVNMKGLITDIYCSIFMFNVWEIENTFVVLTRIKTNCEQKLM